MIRCNEKELNDFLIRVVNNGWKVEACDEHDFIYFCAGKHVIAEQVGNVCMIDYDYVNKKKKNKSTVITILSIILLTIVLLTTFLL